MQTTQMPCLLTIVIPTLNEAGNIEPLFDELGSVLGRTIDWQIVYVDDDSSDATRDQIELLQERDSRVHMIHRIGRRGLSSACLEGMAATQSKYILVMDADLQHDTRIIPYMLKALQSGEADLVVGSRFRAGSNVNGLSYRRRMGSVMMNRLIGCVLRGNLSDPLSGYFMLSRSVYDSIKYKVSGVGFKILIDIIMSCGAGLQIKELSFDFRPRHQGTSKLDISIISEFLGLIIEKLSRGRLPIRFLMFIMVGSFGAIVHFAVMVLLYVYLGCSFLLAQSAAIYSAIFVNFCLNNAFTYRDQRLRGWSVLSGLLLFILVCSVGAANNLIVAEALHRNGVFWFLASFVGAVYGSVWNYFMTNILVWFKAKPSS